MQGNWERQTGKYQNGMDYKLGSIKVASAFYDGLVSSDNPKKYSTVILLPGVKTNNPHFFDLEAAQHHVEELVKAWFIMVQT